MRQTYRAIIRGSQIICLGEAPAELKAVEVYVT
jgi:hypothetical protein